MLKGQNDSDLVGWRVWYCINDQKVIYDSSVDNWTSLPVEGVQVLLRKYSNGAISFDTSKDFYLLKSGDINSIKVALPSSIKLTGPRYTDQALWNAAWDEYKKITNDENNSIDLYVNTKKKAQGWTALYGAGNKLTVYRSGTTSWADLPQEGMLILLRHYKLNNTVWTERNNNNYIYTEQPSNEVLLDSQSSEIKRGSICDPILLQEMMDEARALETF